MNPPPQISLIVPVYNGAAHLRETLEALMAQSFRDFELLLVDDGSRDGSAEVVRSIKDPRIRYIYQENRGLCHALNRGIAEAAAPLIARNDQDDVSMPRRLERQLETLQRYPDALALYAHYTKFGARRRWDNADKQTVNDGSVRDIEPLRDGCMLGSTLFARTDALRAAGGFRQEHYPCDDYDLEMRLAERGRILLLCEPLVAYRFHTTASTYRLFAEMQNKSRWTEDSRERRLARQPEMTFEEFLASRRLGAGERFQQWRLDASKLHMRVAGQRYLDGRDAAALAHLVAAMALDPPALYRRFRTKLANRFRR